MGLLFSMLLVTAPGSGRAAAEQADVILLGGKILTVDPQFSIAQAAAIQDGKFIAVGRNSDVLQYEGPDTKRIDLEGKTVIPGLIDAHAHVDREGLKYVYPSLAGAATRQEILAIIRQAVQRARPGEWIVTMPLGDPPFFFNARDILDRTGLNRRDLDTVSPSNPVYIRGIWGFWDRPPLVSVANSEALRVAGIDAGTRPPYPGIVIEKDSTDELTGVFRENNNLPALEHSLFKAAPRFTHEDRVNGLRKAMQIYNAAGTTGAYEGHGVAAEVVQAYKELWARNELTIRSNLVISPTPGWYSTSTRPEIEPMFRDWAAYAGGQGFGDDYLRTTGVLFQQGGDPALAAILNAELPYTGWAGYYYDTTVSPNVFLETAMLAAKHELRLHFIAPGGDLLATALSVFEQVNKVYSITDKRWVIEHINSVTPDQLTRMKQLGIVPTAIPANMIWKPAPPANLDNFSPYKTLLRAGLPLALGTDNVPPNPFFVLWTAITRENRSTDMPLDGSNSEKLTREEALRAMTINGAYLSFEEKVKGSIEVGKYADLVVLDRDYMEVHPSEIKDIKPAMTMVGGAVVFGQ